MLVPSPKNTVWLKGNICQEGTHFFGQLFPRRNFPAILGKLPSRIPMNSPKESKGTAMTEGDLRSWITAAHLGGKVSSNQATLLMARIQCQHISRHEKKMHRYAMLSVNHYQMFQTPRTESRFHHEIAAPELPC